MSFRNMKVRTRLAFIALIAVAGVVTASAITYLKLAADMRTAEVYKANVVARQELLAQVNGQLGYGGMIHRFKNIVIRGNADLKTKFYENHASLLQLADALAAQPNVTDREKAAMATLVATVEQYRAGTDKAYELWQSGTPISDIDKALKVDDAPALAAIREINDANREYTERASRLQSGIVTASLGLVIAMFGMIAAAIVLLLYVTYRALSRQLGGEPADVAELVGKIADGDLTVAMATKPGDQSSLLRAVVEMRDKLAGIVGEVRSGTDAIATASVQIAAGNADLSARTEAQASSLEETAASIEELTTTVQQNADNARQANALASSASEVAVKGGAVVADVVDTMESINQSAKKIADIIGVIDGIAFQTNILALNAAVEAARAGEQGRGFAVVASEVRVLAQRSAAAAKEIKALIGDSVGKVDAGCRLVEQAGKTMDDIVASVRRVTDIMGEIAAASGEQTAGIGQINQAIVQMDHTTQQNAALVEQSAAAAASLEDKAGILARTVAAFKVNGAVAGSSMARAGAVSVPAVRAQGDATTNRPPHARKALASNRSGTVAAVHPPRGAHARGSLSGEWEQF